MSQHDCLLKLVLTGDKKVGKSMIVNQFVSSHFRTDYTTTVGVDCNTKTMTMNDKKIKLHLWDTSGKERYLSATTAYYPGADMVMFVYDITNPRSYENLAHWMELAKMNASTRTTMVVGNKADLEHLRVVSRERGKQFAQEVQALFAEVSAKSGENVKMAFLSGVREAMSKTQCQRHKKEDKTTQTKHINMCTITF